MQDESKRREARMMEAVAGLGGRSALSCEVDLRLGLAPSAMGLPGWIEALAGLLRKHGQARPGSTSAPSPEKKPLGCLVPVFGDVGSG